MVEILSLSIAFLAVIISPIISYKIAKKNLEFQFRSMTQEKWIDKLEQTAIQFLDNNVKWIEKYQGFMKRHNEGTLSTNDVNNEIDKMLDSINVSIVKFSILLDDTKNEQKEITESAFVMKKLLLKKEINQDVLDSLRSNHEKIVSNLKVIFQSERKKIARLFR